MYLLIVRMSLKEQLGLNDQMVLAFCFGDGKVNTKAM